MVFRNLPWYVLYGLYTDHDSIFVTLLCFHRAVFPHAAKSWRVIFESGFAGLFNRHVKWRVWNGCAILLQGMRGACLRVSYDFATKNEARKSIEEVESGHNLKLVCVVGIVIVHGNWSRSVYDGVLFVVCEKTRLLYRSWNIGASFVFAVSDCDVKRLHVEWARYFLHAYEGGVSEGVVKFRRQIEAGKKKQDRSWGDVGRCEERHESLLYRAALPHAQWSRRVVFQSGQKDVPYHKCVWK